MLAQPAHASAHRAIAVGHAHIDSAWLWPTRETVRKFARTISNVLELIDRDDDFVFVASSAQQYAWIEEKYPKLFERVRAAVAAGRIQPIGGMWVESDATMIGGESMIRQFLLGTRFFREAFGVESDIVWLPDSFGFSAALPQIFRGVGARGFVTQKMSWSDTNRMPHHTFAWEGIDGSRILTHFPPVDSYMSNLGAADLEKAERQYAEKGTGSSSIVPFGWGDGGGGPTREMIALGRRKRDLEGSPRVEFGAPGAFFDEARDEFPAPAIWSGELYLELHRGVFTSQAQTKQGNRRSERLLHEAELWAAATAAVRVGRGVPGGASWSRRWRKQVLLQQFHDILPGHLDRLGARGGRTPLRARWSAEARSRWWHASLAALAGAGGERIASHRGGQRDRRRGARPPGCWLAPVAGGRGDGVAPRRPSPVRARAWCSTSGALRVVLSTPTGRVASRGRPRHRAATLIPEGARAGVLQAFRDRPNAVGRLGRRRASTAARSDRPARRDRPEVVRRRDRRGTCRGGSTGSRRIRAARADVCGGSPAMAARSTSTSGSTGTRRRPS